VPNRPAFVGQLRKSTSDLLGVLSDGIGAFFDHSSLLLLADHFEVSDDSSQFGDQGHRANGVVVGRFLFLEGKA
jgi:hypothetical protein